MKLSSKQDLRSFLDFIKYYYENDAIISFFMGFQRAYKAPNQEINGMNHGACHTRMLL